MKNKKIAIAVIGGVATVGLGYLVLSLLKKKPATFGEVITDTKETIVNAPKSITAMVTGSYKDIGFPLRKGSGGENVRKLQRFLNDSANYNLVVDGKFGEKTELAVIQEQEPFQTFLNMYPDAKKGQITKEYFDAFIKGRY